MSITPKVFGEILERVEGIKLSLPMIIQDIMRERFGVEVRVGPMVGRRGIEGIRKDGHPFTDFERRFFEDFCSGFLTATDLIEASLRKQGILTVYLEKRLGRN